MQPPSGVTNVTIQRAVSGASGIGDWTRIYAGPPQPVYIDVGDSLPAPLSSGSSYLWQVSDNIDSVQVGPVTPVNEVIAQPDMLTNLLIRLLQGGINSLTLPPYIVAPANGSPAQITTRMPQQGLNAMPFIVVNPDLIQQTEVQIGEDTPYMNIDNQWLLWANAKRVWTVTVMCADPQERDFYRDTILIMFRVIKATVFAPIGYDVSQSFQAHSFTDAKEWDGHTPGFYAAEIMLEINGVFNTAVATNYPVIEQIDVGVTVTPGDEVTVVVPEREVLS